MLVLLAAGGLVHGAPSVRASGELCAATGSPFGPFDLQTYEAADYRYSYGHAMELAGYNQLFPMFPGFAVPSLQTGGRDAGSGQPGPAYIPPVLLKAIGWMESGWAQGSYDPLVQYGEVGPVLVSADCGYGIMQITSGMQNISGIPNLEQAMTGSHFAFNIARGAGILADKWNLAPEARPIVGNRDPSIIENWYYALWAYNGFVYKNHPLNPAYDPGRPPFSCGPDNDGLGHDRTRYPYQELVLGCVAHPPMRGGVLLWQPQAVSLPNLSDPAFGGPLSPNNWNACSYSAQCASMDLPTAGGHTDATPLTVSRDDVLGLPALGVSQDQITLNYLPSGTKGSASLYLTNTGSGVLAWRATASASWLKLSRFQAVTLGGDLGGGYSTISITADTTGLAPGRYQAQITIESMYGGGTPRSIPVTLDMDPEGSLLKGSGPDIYQVKGGLKRRFPNAPTFLAGGNDWGRIVSVSDGVLNSLPTGADVPNIVADGVLVHGSASAVYVLEGGARRHLTSPAAMEACGYGWDSILVIPDSAIAAIPQTTDFGGPPCPRYSVPDGALATNSAGHIYVVSVGILRYFPNMASLEARGVQFGNIDRYPDGVLSAMPAGRALPNPMDDGNLIKGSASDVFAMQGHAKRRILGPSALDACGYGWSAVIQLSDASMAGIAQTADLGRPPCPHVIPGDGALLRNSAGTVFYIDQGRKRAIPSAQSFDWLEFHWGDIDQTPDSIIQTIPTGADVPDVLANGALLQGSSPGIYAIDHQQRRLIGGPQVMQQCGYGWDAVLRRPDSVLNSIPLTVDLSGPPCP